MIKVLYQASTLHIFITCWRVSFYRPLYIMLTVARQRARGISQKEWAAVPGFRVCMYIYAYFRFFLQYFIIFVILWVHLIMTNFKDKMWLLSTCLLACFLEYWRFGGLCRIRLLDFYLSLILRTSPRFHSGSIQLLQLLQMYKHPNLPHSLFSSFFKSNMPSCRPLKPCSLLFCFWKLMDSRRSILTISMSLQEVYRLMVPSWRWERTLWTQARTSVVQHWCFSRSMPWQGWWGRHGPKPSR